MENMAAVSVCIQEKWLPREKVMFEVMWKRAVTSRQTSRHSCSGIADHFRREWLHFLCKWSISRMNKWQYAAVCRGCSSLECTCQWTWSRQLSQFAHCLTVIDMILQPSGLTSKQSAHIYVTQLQMWQLFTFNQMGHLLSTTKKQTCFSSPHRCLTLDFLGAAGTIQKPAMERGPRMESVG